MPTRLPNSVQEAWGSQAAEDFSDWLDEYVRTHAVHRDEYREVLSRLDVIDERFDQIDERFERVDDRLDRLEKRFDQLSQKLDAQSSELNQRFDNQNQQLNDRIDRLHEQTRVMMRWTIGTIALFGTIVTVLIAIAEFGG